MHTKLVSWRVGRWFCAKTNIHCSHFLSIYFFFRICFPKPGLHRVMWGVAVLWLCLAAASPASGRDLSLAEAAETIRRHNAFCPDDFRRRADGNVSATKLQEEVRTQRLQSAHAHFMQCRYEAAARDLMDVLEHDPWDPKARGGLHAIFTRQSAEAQAGAPAA